MQILQEEIGGVKGHFGPINALAFNPDGKRCGLEFKLILHLFDLIIWSYWPDDQELACLNGSMLKSE